MFELNECKAAVDMAGKLMRDSKDVMLSIKWLVKDTRSEYRRSRALHISAMECVGLTKTYQDPGEIMEGQHAL